MLSASRRSLSKPAAVALALVAIALSGGHAGESAQQRANAWTKHHVLTISDGGDVNTLNSHLGQFAAVANLSEMTMAWLVKWDEHNRPYPELATAVPSRANGGVSKDGLAITYHIRHGVKWSDGAPFTADDVAFSTAVVNNPANNEAGRLDQIAGVEEPDKFTIVYHLRKPYASSTVAFFSSCCANPSLLPKHLLARYPNINTAPYNALPVGIGPFKFERWDRSKQVVLVANERYWRGRPKLDKIVYKVIPSHDDLLAKLASHDVDMWYQFSGSYLERIRALSGYEVFEQPSYAYNHFDFNVTHAAVGDSSVRQALRLAFNRRAIVDKVEHGVGTVQDSALPPTAPYFSDMGTTAYDPDKANALLDAGGWIRGPDGVRERNGVKLNLNVAVIAGRPDVDEQVAIVRTGWERIGVHLSVRRYPAASMFAPAKQGGLVYGNDWDVISFTWAADPLGDFSGIYGCNAFPPAAQNNLRWCDPAAQTAMDAFQSHDDQPSRTADLRALMRAFIDDAPSIVSFFRRDLFAYNSDLKNYHPNNVTPFDNMMNVDI